MDGPYCMTVYRLEILVFILEYGPLKVQFAAVCCTENGNLAILLKHEE